MKQIYVRASSLQPIAVSKNGVVIDKGTSAIINGPCVIKTNPQNIHPKIWIEVEDDIVIEINNKKNNPTQ
jgi:hypothetical protein